jgi:hypothetical protein
MMRMLAALLAFGAVTLTACSDQRENDMSLPPQPIDWSSIAQKRVIFAHQSVGENILSGVDRLAKSNGVTIGIHDQRGTSLPEGITHFKVGRNGDPESKMSGFAAALDAADVSDADVAMMKLCYLDFNRATDARRLAEVYANNLDALAQRYPKTTFVAVTTPLTTVQTGPKAWIKRLMGRAPAQYAENAKRAEFNALLRDRYLADGRLFDLARVEATGAGRAISVDVDGQEVEALDPALTSDGGHLNDRGQNIVAAAFLQYLGSLPNK